MCKTADMETNLSLKAYEIADKNSKPSKCIVVVETTKNVENKTEFYLKLKTTIKWHLNTQTRTFRRKCWRPTN